MEETYERHLADIVAAMPEEPCIVALVPTIPLEDAAALASDVAQRIGASRSGHTILTSFESHPSRLDHEIGVEGGAGLTDVLSKDVTAAQAAARGRARGFVYLPAGAGALPGEVLLRSEAWRMLSAAVLRGGGSVLAVVPPIVFEAVNEGLSEGAGRRFDALVWLGSSTDARQEIQWAAIASGARDLGSVRLPAGPEPEAPEPEPVSPLERRAAFERRSKADRRAVANRRAADERRFKEGTAAKRTAHAKPLAPPEGPAVERANGPASIVGLATRMGHGPRRHAWERKKRRDRSLVIFISIVVVVSISILVLRGPFR